MASLSDVFTEKERTNWLKAWLAVDIAKSGLEQFVDNEAKAVHTNIYNTVWTSIQSQATCLGCHTANLLKCPTQGVCNKRGAQSTCTSMHDDAAKQPRPCPANVCNKVHDEIVKQHAFNKPSWKNTMAQQWVTNPWQIAKAYLPPDGYAGKCSVQDTDFNGIISFMMNCKHFDNKLLFPIAPGQHNALCLLTKAREIGRTVRHSSQCKLTDADLQDIFTTLTDVLSDPKCLAHDVAAQEAVNKLAELQKDTLKITTEEMIHLLGAAQDKLQKVQNIADEALKMQMNLNQFRKDINEHTDKCKQELDDHTAKCTHAIDEHVNKTVESTYEQSCKEKLGIVDAQTALKTLEETHEEMIRSNECERKAMADKISSLEHIMAADKEAMARLTEESNFMCTQIGDLNCQNEAGIREVSELKLKSQRLEETRDDIRKAYRKMIEASSRGPLQSSSNCVRLP